MLGHSSLQMIFQRYYAWIPRQTCSDGQAFQKYFADAVPKSPDNAQNTDAEKNKSDKKCTNFVPPEEYRNKKRA
jgi:hypothetical protein